MANVVGALYLIDYAIVRKDPEKDKFVSPAYNITQEANNTILANEKAMEPATKKWLKQIEGKDSLEVISRDWKYMKLRAVEVEQPGSHKWVIAVHGYKRDHHYMENIGRKYAEQGFQVLLPDLQGHGDSEGRYIGMGKLECEDMKLWIDYILKKDPQAQIVLHGISMGAATVMMTAGEKLPANVKCIVEDCGYADAYQLFKDELQQRFGMKEFPLLTLAEIIGRQKAEYSFKEAKPLEAVKKAKVPMLFIHGSKDTFINPADMDMLYEACASKKERLLIEGAPHAKAYLLQPDLYFAKVFEFVNANM